MKILFKESYLFNCIIKFAIFFLIIFSGTYDVSAQHESSIEMDKKAIKETIAFYFDGTKYGDKHKLEKAFHPDFNLYSRTKEDKLKVWSGKDYVGGIKEGKTNSREGKILTIDFVDDVGVAKAEVKIPGWRVFTDYFLLVKYEGSWKIIHKSYTSRSLKKK